MTRTECEKLIIEKLKEISEIHKQYNPNADYLSMSISESDNYIAINNKYYGKDLEYAINKWTFAE